MKQTTRFYKIEALLPEELEALRYEDKNPDGFKAWRRMSPRQAIRKIALYSCGA